MNIRAFIKTHKISVIIALIIFVLFIALSFVRCSQLAYERNTQKMSDEQQQSEAKDDKKEVKLTQAQQTLTEQYSQTAKDALASLASYNWISSDDTLTVKFTKEGTYTTTQSGCQSDPKTYAISATMGASIAGDKSKASDDAAPTIIALLLSDGKTALLSIQRVPDKDTVKLIMTTEAFGSTGTFEAKRPQEKIKIEGMSEDIQKQIGKDGVVAFKKAVEKEVRDNYPSATKAVCESVVMWDAQAGTVQLSFDLDDVRGTKLTAVWLKSDNTFTFSDGRSQ